MRAAPAAVEQTIAEVIARALPDALQPVGAGLRNPPEMGGDLTGYGQQIVDATTPAVVAAIRAMSPQRQAELIGGVVSNPSGSKVRVVGPWVEVRDV